MGLFVSLVPKVDPHAPAKLWNNFSFLLMSLSVMASGFGDRVIHLAALTLLGANSKSVDGTSLSAGLMFFFFLPYLLLGAPAGWLADRLPRKWIMLACDEARAAGLLAAFLLIPVAGPATIGPKEAWCVFALVGSVGIFAAIFSPARNATIAQIIPADQLPAGKAVILGITVAAALAGFGCGAWMFDPASAGTVRAGLVTAFLFYAVSGTFFAFLKVRRRGDRLDGRVATGGRRCREIGGLAYVLGHRAVCRLILGNVLIWAVAMLVYNAALGLCKVQYGLPGDLVIRRYGVMAMLIGLGMLLASAWVGWINSRRELGWITMAAQLAAGFAAVLLAASGSYTLSLALGLAVGFFGHVTMIGVVTLLQNHSPNYMRGRVMGLNALATTISTVAVNLVIWQMDDADTIIIRALGYAGWLLVIVAIWNLRRLMSAGPMDSRFVNILWHLVRAYALSWHRLQWVNRHHVPSSGPVILASNHTTGLDPFLIQIAVPRTIRWVMDRAYRFQVLGFLWRAIDPISISRSGPELAAVRQIIRLARAGQIIGIFPEGGAQRESRQLIPFRAGVGLIAVRAKAAIVPVWIDGTPKTRHMFWHFARPSRAKVIFGRPFRPDATLKPQQITKQLHRRMLELADTCQDVARSAGNSAG